MLVIQTDHPRIDPTTLNKAVIDRRIAQFRQDVRRDPNDETAHYGLGVAYFNLGLLDDAARELSEAARLVPENPNIQHQLAVVYTDLAAAGDPYAERNAWDRLSRTLLLRPSAPDPYLLKAQLHLRRGERQAAISSWHHAHQIAASSIRQPIASFLRSNRDTFLRADQFRHAVPKRDFYIRRTVVFVLVTLAIIAATVMIIRILPNSLEPATPYLTLVRNIAVACLLLGPVLLVRRGQRAQRLHHLTWSSKATPEGDEFLSGCVADSARMLKAAQFVHEQLMHSEKLKANHEREVQRRAELERKRAATRYVRPTIIVQPKRAKTSCLGCGMILILAVPGTVVAATLVF